MVQALFQYFSTVTLHCDDGIEGTFTVIESENQVASLFCLSSKKNIDLRRYVLIRKFKNRSF